MQAPAIEAIPPGALAAFINMLLILIAIWIGNASDFLRDRLQKVGRPLGSINTRNSSRRGQHFNPTPRRHPLLPQNKDMRCWSVLQLLTDIPDATIGVLVGMAAGLVLKQVWGLRLRFSDQLFFYGVLPPIIFCTCTATLSRVMARGGQRGIAAPVGTDDSSTPFTTYPPASSPQTKASP